MLRKMNTRKVAFSIGVALALGISWFLIVIKKPPRRNVADSDLRPNAYNNLAQCERSIQGEINCPDIRHRGKTRLRQAQLALTRMLRIFDLIAKKHGIRYWLYRGTLVGAVRHNGHNPFDDDVDICIPKSDFEQFVEKGAKELPDDIFFQSEETDPHWKVPYVSGMLGKLRDTRSCLKTCITGCKYNDGLTIDMFVVESDDYGNFIEMYSSPHRFLRLIYSPIVREHSEIFPLTQVNFDGFSLPAPREWKKILRALYGDFMIIPPTEPLAHKNTDALHSCKEIDPFTVIQRRKKN